MRTHLLRIPAQPMRANAAPSHSLSLATVCADAVHIPQCMRARCCAQRCVAVVAVCQCARLVARRSRRANVRFRRAAAAVGGETRAQAVRDCLLRGLVVVASVVMLA